MTRKRKGFIQSLFEADPSPGLVLETTKNASEDYLEAGILEIIKSLNNATQNIIFSKVYNFRIDESVIDRYILLFNLLNKICIQEDTRIHQYRRGVHDEKNESDLFRYFNVLERINPEDVDERYLREVAERFYRLARDKHEDGDKIEALRCILITIGISYYSYWMIGENLPSKNQYDESLELLMTEISTGYC